MNSRDVTRRRVVLVGRFTPTDVYPPHGNNWEAFAFDSREEAIAWPEAPWYPDPLILDLQEPAR